MEQPCGAYCSSSVCRAFESQISRHTVQRVQTSARPVGQPHPPRKTSPRAAPTSAGSLCPIGTPQAAVAFRSLYVVTHSIRAAPVSVGT